MNTKVTARDFFLQLGVMVTLYAGAIALLNLLFRVIDRAFPPVNQYFSNFYTPSPISFPVATLVVVFPLFLILSSVVQRNYSSDPSLREGSMRKWLLYITLFISGVIIAGDLITLIYRFLDGQDITWGFILKVVSVLVVTAAVFGYYLADLRGNLSRRSRNIWRVFSIILIVGSIIMGFLVLGSPATQRARRYDSQRISDLENIQWQVVSYYREKNGLPGSMSDLENSMLGYQAPRDPESGAAYEYTLIGQSAKAFELCGTFSRPGPEQYAAGNSMPIPVDKSAIVEGSNNWKHEAGHQCFTRTIDPDFYPPINNDRVRS